PVERDVVGLADSLPEVVRGQHGVVADLVEAGPAVGPDVRVRAHEDAGVAYEGPQPPDRLRTLVTALEAERAVVLAEHPRRRQVREEGLPHADRSRTRAAPAVRRRER